MNISKETKIKLYKKIVLERLDLFKKMGLLSIFVRSEAKQRFKLEQSWKAKTYLQSKILAKI
jgi:hypothetical protein